MPTYRVQTRDGAERTVWADRVIADWAQTAFERRSEGQWETVLVVPNRQVAGVFRRVTEAEGRPSWVTERPQQALGRRFR